MTEPATTTTAPATQEFPFDKVFPTNRITILWGNPGAGKSSLTNHYALQHVKHGGKLLHIEVDETLEEMRPRLADINEHVKCPANLRKGRFQVLRPVGLKINTEDGAAELKRLVLHHKPTLLILSPIGMMVKGDLNSQEVATESFEAIKQAKAEHNCTVIMHGHLNKKGVPTGSQFWSNLTDMSWLLEKLPDLEDGAPHRMVVTALKTRVDAGMGFEWLLVPPNHGIRFVKYRRDSITVEDRFTLSTVLGFVNEKYRNNWIEATKAEEKEDWDQSTGRKKKKAPNKWVTVADFIEEHETGLGGKAAAYKAFQLARERSLVGQLANGPLGVQRFYPTERTVRWLNDNAFGSQRPPPPPAFTAGPTPIVAPVVSATTSKTEEELNIESWESRPEEERDEWDLGYEDHNEPNLPDDGYFGPMPEE